MGTNYFAVDERKQKIHIGKHSLGWKFIFHGYDIYNFKIKTLKDWETFLLRQDVRIYDSEDKEIGKKFFLKIIENSTNQKRHLITKGEKEEWYDEQGFAFLNHYFS